ncbi:MAG: alginate lyase family protein [Caldilineaceae bacterium]
MLRKLKTGYQVWRHFGANWLAFRARYALRLRMGALKRRLPAKPWSAQPLADFLANPTLHDPEAYWQHRRSQAPPFFFDPAALTKHRPLFAAWDVEAESPQASAEALAQGVFRYFENTTAPLGFPPQWHHNPFSGQRAPTDQHWSALSDFGYGDIKVIWEPSRFGFVYLLVRAYWRTGDERYPELFWQLLEDWRAQNPPQLGPNWKCGQETSFRVMAWCFGLYGFLLAPATTPARVNALAQMVAVSGQRIEANLDYAISQRNNHGISEGLGLWTIGLLFPELIQAKRWVQRGRQVLETLGQELIYADGAFAQHSVNYHRLMLHDYLWAIRLGELQGQALSPALKRRVVQAGQLLYQLQDTTTGRVPLYGQTDGALILPLSNCDYLDFRPVVQATHYLATGERCYPRGPWDEDLLWLFGPGALEAPLHAPAQEDLQAESSGYYTLRSTDAFVFTRCATYRDRPSQADMLHVDLWWRSQNIALDAGTYSYNAPAPWNNSFAHTAYHNTVTVDSLDQMAQVGKFMWLPWLHSRMRVMKKSPHNQLGYWEGEHDGYNRLRVPVSYRRAIVRLGETAWLVLDALASQAPHIYRLHWLLADFPYVWDGADQRLQLTTPGGPYSVQAICLSGQTHATLARADPNSPRGWRAAYYYHRQPALSLALTQEANETYFCTLFSTTPCDITSTATHLRLATAQWTATLHRSITPAQPLATRISLTGAHIDTLDLA